MTGRLPAADPAAAPSPGEVRYGAVILSQGTRPRELMAAVESLLRQRDVTVDLAVVGNGWQPAGLPPEVTCVALPENLGIPAGRNAGVPHVSGEYLFFLDDDEVLPDDGVLAEMARRMAADPRIGMIQPRIDVLGGGVAPRRWTPRSRVGDRTRSGMVFSVLEGALAIRRDVFEAAGGWFEPFWYAHEGTELAWRVWDTGHRVLYAGDLVAEHPLTYDTRHEHFYRMQGRHRVWLARRNLPLPFAVVYVLSWGALEVLRSFRSPAGALAFLRGMWEGLTTPVERRRLKWRTIATMTRYGRPPVW